MATPITYLLFDLDETLYPSSSGMVGEISRRMTRYVARYLDLDKGSATRLRNRLSRKHGSTLTGLMSEHDLRDPEDYLAFAHPTEVHRYLDKDPEMAAALRSISIPKSILTNAPEEHARRILKYLEIEELFERIFDIRLNDFRGKPAIAVYRKVLDKLGLEASEVLFIDNRLDYLQGYRAIGGRVLWVDDQNAGPETHQGVARITHIKELPAFLHSI